MPNDHAIDPPLRSVLFAPGHRRDVLEKLPRSGPDGAVIDLEDAVAPDAKAEARTNAAEVGPKLAATDQTMAVFVRINAPTTSYFADDVADGLRSGITGVLVPKLESRRDVEAVHDVFAEHGVADLTIVAGIESALGVANVREILESPSVGAAYFGAEDFIADMGGVRTASNHEVAYARGRCALAARVAEIPVLDQVVADFGDADRLLAEGREARAMGYAGKLCIHPKQVAVVHEAFRPTAAEVEEARGMLDALASSDGVAVYEGQMIDEPLARRARAVLAAAEG